MMIMTTFVNLCLYWVYVSPKQLCILYIYMCVCVHICTHTHTMYIYICNVVCLMYLHAHFKEALMYLLTMQWALA